MNSRMDKYKNHDNNVPTRSNKNQELYKQIYNAYDEFENLVVPSNAREITMSELKKEIASRTTYHEKKNYDDTPVNSGREDDIPIQKEKKHVKEEPQVYDIRELLDKAVSNHDNQNDDALSLSSGDYLKKIKLDNRKTNIEQVKELYEDTMEEEMDSDDSLLKTANLSLEILSDLKSDNDQTMVEAPIKNSELPEEAPENDFYSSKYKFSKKDFESKEEVVEEDDDDADDTFGEDNDKVKKFVKILLLVFGILLIIILLLYIFKFFNRV